MLGDADADARGRSNSGEEPLAADRPESPPPPPPPRLSGDTASKLPMSTGRLPGAGGCALKNWPVGPSSGLARKLKLAPPWP